MSNKIRIFKLRPTLTKNKAYFEGLLFAIAIFAFIATGYYNGFQIKANLKNIYEIRADFATVKLPTIVSYLINPAAIIIPLGIIYFYQKHRYATMTLLIFIQLAIFAMGAHKFVFFLLLLTIISAIFYKEKYFNLVPTGLIGLNAIGIFESYFTNKPSMVINYIQRRVLFVPNFLSFKYFEFFSENPVDYFKQSFLRHFGEKSIYSESPKMIGEVC